MEVTDWLVISMFISFMVLLVLGFHVVPSLIGISVIFTGIAYLSDIYLDTFTGMGLNFLGMGVRRLYQVMSNGILVAIPMFIFMGLMLEKSGLAENLMRSSQDLFGRLRGGLAITMTFMGVLLAASTGIIGASVVLLGLMGIPTMLKQGYSKELATGVVAGAGTLGILIPPSIMLVFMGDQLRLNVGDLFMGAVFPGLILAALYVFYILIYSYLRPGSAPLDPERRPITFRTFLLVLRDIIPPAALIVAVLGSIFAGMATVTEASGVGALGGMILAWINRNLRLSVVKEVVLDTFNVCGYMFGILCGATIFALVLRGLGGDELIERVLIGLPFGPMGIIIFILFCVFLLGFFLDWMEISLILLPLLAPVVSSLNININGYGVIENPDLIWFVILVAVALQTSFLTPPVGYALFYLKGICPPQVSMKNIYFGIIPFVILQLIGLVLVLVIPELVTWLPAVVYKTP